MDYTILSEEILLRLLRTGDENSFREIYLRYWNRLFATAYHKLKDREAAEEILQNIFLKLWQNRGGTTIEKLENYLFTSLKYNIINVIEKRIVKEKYFKNLKNGEQERVMYFEESLGLRELRSIIERSLSMMPDKTQKIFRLRKIDNYSVLEIARYLEMSEKAVEYHISKSLKILRTHLKDYVIPILFLFSFTAAYGQAIQPLYTSAIPNSKNVADEEQWRYDPSVDTLVTNVSHPSFYVFQPPAGKRNGTAVIICPGGGYHVICIDMEGKKVAKAFNEAGVTAFVLKYRLPSDRTMHNKSIGPLQDVQQAIKTIRSNARKWNIDPGKIGVMGFSAGGHLAAMSGTQFEKPALPGAEKELVRPDFMLLIYPVISFTDSIGHIGSRTNLVGENPSDSIIRKYSNELNVTANTPPTFLTHSSEDSVVLVANSIRFFEKLSQNRVPVAMHIFSKGVHGYLSDTPPFKEWFGRCVYWMKEMKFIPASSQVSPIASANGVN